MARYYYASGERVPIEPDEEQVAVDAARAGPEQVARLLSRAGPSPQLPGGVLLLRRDRVGAEGVRGLAAQGALWPVYRAGGAALVALPEIRVELDGEAQRRAVLEALPRAPHPVEIAEQGPDRIVLRPCSGSGEEALEVANFLFEAARPAASSVRFVRFVARPEPKR